MVRRLGNWRRKKMKIAHGTLVMAADGEKALLFRNEGDRKFIVLQTLTHEAVANPPTHEIGSDRPGRSFSSVGRRRSGYGETDWHRETKERFAKQAAEMLEEAAEGNEVGLVIVAPPQFLGSLRDQFGASMKRRLVAEITKDLVHHETDDVAEAIARHVEQHPIDERQP
jgi:protein required for attachment to host cells